MEFIKLNEKRKKVKSVLKIFNFVDEDDRTVKICDENTWLILEMEVNCERMVNILGPEAAKVIYDRLVDYGKTNEKITFYGFNRYIMDLGDPAYFSSDLSIVVIQDDGFESFGEGINRDKIINSANHEMLKINPTNPDMKEEWWCMNDEKD